MCFPGNKLLSLCSAGAKIAILQAEATKGGTPAFSKLLLALDRDGKQDAKAQEEKCIAYKILFHTPGLSGLMLSISGRCFRNGDPHGFRVVYIHGQVLDLFRINFIVCLRPLLYFWRRPAVV